MAGEQNVKIAFTGKIDGQRLCPAGETDTYDETLGGEHAVITPADVIVQHWGLVMKWYMMF